MKQHIKDSVTPNKTIGNTTSIMILTFWCIFTLLIWFSSDSKIFPNPINIGIALMDLITKNDFIRELISSTMFCLKAMFYAVVVSFIFAYLSVIPLFRPICAFVAKARFLSTAGLTFLMAEMTQDTSGQKIALLVFAISVFLVTSMIGVIMEVKKEDLDYARTLRLNEWEAVWEVIIKGKMDQMFEVIRQSFAISWVMLTMVENLCRADGGIGVILTDQNKHFHMDQVFAIQIVILLIGISFDYLLKKSREWLFPYSVIKLERK